MRLWRYSSQGWLAKGTLFAKNWKRFRKASELDLKRKADLFRIDHDPMAGNFMARISAEEIMASRWKYDIALKGKMRPIEATAGRVSKSEIH